MPDLDVIRPADANELSALWQSVLENHDRPTVMVLTRQTVPTIDCDKYASAGGARRGAYILADGGGNPDVILLFVRVRKCISVWKHTRSCAAKA